MGNLQLKTILAAYKLALDDYKLSKLGDGHIHQTFLMTPVNEIGGGKKYVLQQLNTKVFKKPVQLAENHQLVVKYLGENAPDYYFLRFIATDKAELLASFQSTGNERQYWRLMPYLEGDVYETVEHPTQAYMAAKAFARFSALMAKADKSRFHKVLAGFHDAGFRWNQLIEAEKAAKSERLSKAVDALLQLKKAYWIVEKASRLEQLLPERIQHMDAKISNVIFTKSADKSVVLLDLDTIMPANILSDVGDMIRTMAASVSENEADFSKAFVRKEVFEAIKTAYLEGMGNELTALEKDNFKFAGQKMIHLQAVRFLTDYLNENIYYPVQHDDQNLLRCLNQLSLLDSINEL